ncbi:MAG: DUF87 domain-containing protein [Mariprofundaceae bacterium]|nr:DUF87 domain-containing protein [Mariprofundaceae bacterium]
MQKNEEMLINIIKKKDAAIPRFPCSQKDMKTTKKIKTRNINLFHIEELTYEKDSPRKEALENVISSLGIDGINFVYLLIGDKSKVSFYFGVASIEDSNDSSDIDVDDIGKYILKPSFEGNFRGSKLIEKQPDKKKRILKTIQGFQRVGKVEGVPSVNDEKEEFQGVDRLTDIMMGDEFAFMIIADPLREDEISTIENKLYHIHDKLAPLAKTSVQENKGESKTTAITDGTSDSTTKGRNSGSSESDAKGISKGSTTSKSDGYTLSDGKNGNSSTGANEGSSDTFTVSASKGDSSSNTTGSSHTKNESIAENNGISKSREFSDKAVQEWIKYIDEILFPRVDYGKNKGLFYTGIYLLAHDRLTLLKLGNTVKSIFSGVENNKAPLQLVDVKHQEEINAIQNFQLPILSSHHESENQIQEKILFSRSHQKVAHWFSTKELSVVASLPKKEVVGLSLKEEVEFGLNMKRADIADEDKVLLGSLVKSGNILSIPIYLDKQQLNKHTFIAGVTGSGKTTTCQRILDSAQYPFLVIEPAKTEYRVLITSMDDVLIFTLGNDKVAPFKLNPFELFPNENITSRVDMIKANIEAAFDMEAAIPQIIESALYACYETYGWDIRTSTNNRFDDPFANGVYAFPTLSDLIKQTEVVVEEQGFDDRLKNDYIGSIKARLQGLLLGAKGSMLNTPRSINFTDLLENNVILELEEIKNGSEKSLIMGFVLINLNEALKQKYKAYKKQGKDFKHITLIEEAHRLLAKHTPGDNPSKRLGVETFSDMLAEVRKYGESLIIVDQIPNKLTSEVLKNTNTKIVHRLFASDDKEAIGNTMALDDEQKAFLSSLDVGRVIISSQDFVKPIQVQIQELISTTKLQEVDESTIRKICLKYYQQNYRSGIVQGLETYQDQPSLEKVEAFLMLNLLGLEKAWVKLCQAGKMHGDFTVNIKETLKKNSLSTRLETVRVYLINKFYRGQHDDIKGIETHLQAFLQGVVHHQKTTYSRDDQRLLKIRRCDKMYFWSSQVVDLSGTFEDLETLEVAKHQQDMIDIQKEINEVKVYINKKRHVFYKKNCIKRRW